MIPASELPKLRHDLRTPVNHIIGYADLLGEELVSGQNLLSCPRKFLQGFLQKFIKP